MSRQRKAANLSRRQAVVKERDSAEGDPVESKPTEFIQKLQSQLSPNSAPKSCDDHFSHFLRRENVKTALEYSKKLTAPIPNAQRAIADPQFEKEEAAKHVRNNENAREAVRRIVSIQNGSSKDRLRVNYMTCIEKFGRHETDKYLPPKPAVIPHPSMASHPEKTPRVGVDTGSPEVQVAILTSKILNLSRHLETAKTDRHNKRNLRLLVHRRQKMLKYLRRKERGGPRYQNIMENLGLSDAAWKGEISM